MNCFCKTYCLKWNGVCQKDICPSWCNFYSFNEEIPEELLDATDVDSSFYHNNFDNPQSQHRIVQVSGGSNKKSFAIKLFEFCILKTEQRYILQEKVNISKRGLNCLVDNLRDFLKTFDPARKCIQIPLPKPKVEIGSTKPKDNLFAHYNNDILKHPKRQIRLSFRLGSNNSCVFSISKSLNYKAINSFSQKLSTITIAKFTISTRIDITLQTSVK